MKKSLWLILLLVILGCTKKQVEQQQVDLVVQAMVNGQWKVSVFNKGGIDFTADFSTYTFQFKSNYTVDAINNGSWEKTGNWNADANAKTITSNFINSNNPLLLLNGTWKITNSSWTSVQATETLNGEVRSLRLDKL